MPTNLLQNKSLFRALFGSQPNYHKLHQFGYLCSPFTKTNDSNKLQSKLVHSIFLGYPRAQNTYVGEALSTRHLYLAPHVLFNETRVPFAKPNKSDSPTTVPPSIPVAQSHTVISTPSPSPPLPKMPLMSQLILSSPYPSNLSLSPMISTPHPRVDTDPFTNNSMVQIEQNINPHVSEPSIIIRNLDPQPPNPPYDNPSHESNL